MAQPVVGGAAGELAFGIIFGGGEFVDSITAVFLQQAHEIGLDTAGEDDTAARDFFSGIISGYDSRLYDGDAIATVSA